MDYPIVALNVLSSSEKSVPEIFHEKLGGSEWRCLSDEFDIEQFGVNLEVINPGGSSGLKHWHSHSDEFLYVLSGQLLLQIDDKSFPMKPGMCIGFKAGTKKGHRLINNSQHDATFIVVGSRVSDDKVTYTEDDFQWLEENGETIAAHKDGTKY